MNYQHNKSQLVRAIARQFPERANAEIARELNCSPQLVYNALHRRNAPKRELPSEEAALCQFLPPFERSLLNFYYLEGHSQTALAKRYGMTQAAVSYRIGKAHKRLKFLKEFPQFSEAELRRLLVSAGYDAPHVKLMLPLYASTNQSVAAIAAGSTQGRIRRRLHKTVSELQALVDGGREDLAEVLKGFRMISVQPSILHESPSPTWFKK
jgi:hypothetical protein